VRRALAYCVIPARPHFGENWGSVAAVGFVAPMRVSSEPCLWGRVGVDGCIAYKEDRVKIIGRRGRKTERRGSIKRKTREDNCFKTGIQ